MRCQSASFPQNCNTIEATHGKEKGNGPYAAGLLALTLWVQAGHEARGQSLDQIFPQRGSAASGTVVEMSPNEVKLDVRGEPRTVAVNDIRE